MAPASTVVAEAFLADHRRLEALLAELLIASEARDHLAERKLWLECDAALATHMECEETHLIPALLRLHERDARVVVHEHRHIRRRLAELGAAIAPHGFSPGTVRDFIDEVRAHARSEDRLLYRWADAHLGEPEHIAAIAALTASLGVLSTVPVT